MWALILKMFFLARSLPLPALTSTIAKRSSIAAASEAICITRFPIHFLSLLHNFTPRFPLHCNSFPSIGQIMWNVIFRIHCRHRTFCGELWKACDGNCGDCRLWKACDESRGHCERFLKLLLGRKQLEGGSLMKEWIFMASLLVTAFNAVFSWKLA